MLLSCWKRGRAQDVKNCICSLTEIPCIEQQLIYGARELRDEEVVGKLGNDTAPGLSLDSISRKLHVALPSGTATRKRLGNNGNIRCRDSRDWATAFAIHVWHSVSLSLSLSLSASPAPATWPSRSKVTGAGAAARRPGACQGVAVGTQQRPKLVPQRAGIHVAP